MSELQEKFGTSQRHACELVNIGRSTCRYESQPRTDEGPLSKRMIELVGQRPRFGYRRIAWLLREERWKASDTRIYRLWRREGLKVPRKRKKRKRSGSSKNGIVRYCAEHPDHVWCWDFAFDRTVAGSTLKWLTIVDEYTRECLALKVDRNITSEDVIDTLAELFAMRGVPKCLRSDNGPEMTANELQRWLKQIEVKTLYVEPGSPWENGYAESFFSKLRDEFLAVEEFESLKSARGLTAAWRDDYNNHRPHSSLGYVPPSKFAARCAASATATPALQQHTETT